MHYSVPEAAKLLGVSADLVYDWIRNEGLPATMFGGRYHLNKVRLFDWAYRKRFPLPLQSSPALPVLEDAIRRGGILNDVAHGPLEVILSDVFGHRLMGDRRDSILDQSSSLDAGVCREILGMLAVRDGFGWLSDKDGIAMPLSRSPLAVLPDSSRVYIAYVRRDEQVLPGCPLVVFIILVSAIQMHLELLSRCMLASKDARFHQLLMDRADAKALIDCMRGISVPELCPPPEPGIVADDNPINLS